jgi:hypothetical protein
MKIHACTRTRSPASWAPRRGTYQPCGRRLEAPARGHAASCVTASAGSTHVKRTECEKSTRADPVFARSISFLPRAVGRGQRSNAKNFLAATSLGAEAYWLLKRCCRVCGIERGARRVVRLAIETEVRRTRMQNAPSPAGKAYADAWRRTVRFRFALPCARDSWAPRRLHPPSDAVPVVVASGARAFCAGRAWSRGLPHRPIKAQLPSSFATRFHLHRDGTGRASIVPVGQGRHFWFTRYGITVPPASGFTGKQWHTR